METEAATIPLTVTDVRQYGYCPRVVYYTYVQPLRTPRRGPATYKMDEGKRRHEEVTVLEARRTLRSYGLRDGVRHFNVDLTSERLNLRGRLDLVIETPHEAIPVEFKNTDQRLSLNHKAQLTAYALLVEERWGRPVRRAFVHFIPSRRSREITITAAMRAHTLRLLDNVRHMLAVERMPEGTRILARCRECEFLRFCNDRW